MMTSNSTRFENLIYRALSSGLITESKAAVLLNKTTEEVWRYYIGGYQIAEKWLKDRKGTELDFNAIIHYSNILYVLVHNESLAEGGRERGLVSASLICLLIRNVSEIKGCLLPVTE